MTRKVTVHLLCSDKSDLKVLKELFPGTDWMRDAEVDDTFQASGEAEVADMGLEDEIKGNVVQIRVNIFPPEATDVSKT